MARPLSGPGLKLAEEKHEQKDGEMYQLPVAQRQLDCQFQHGCSPVYAGSAANWLGLAICYTPLHGVALGLPRMALSIGCGLRLVVMTGFSLLSRLDAIKSLRRAHSAP